MINEVYVVILEDEDVCVFTSRQKAWDFINRQDGEYTIMNAELVEEMAIFDEIRSIHKEHKINQYVSYCVVCQLNSSLWYPKDTYPCETIKLLNER